MDIEIDFEEIKNEITYKAYNSQLNRYPYAHCETNNFLSDELTEMLLSNWPGADEFKSNQDVHEIQCSKSEIYNIKKELEKKINNFISTEIEWVPLNSVQIPREKNDDLINFFETLEEDDDIQNVYSNAEFTK